VRLFYLRASTISSGPRGVFDATGKCPFAIGEPAWIEGNLCHLGGGRAQRHDDEPAEDIFEPLGWLSSRKKVFIHRGVHQGRRAAIEQLTPALDVGVRNEGDINMDRRKFITTTGVGAAAAAGAVLTNGSIGSRMVEAQAPQPAAKRYTLTTRLGSNASPYNEADLIRIKRFGVQSIVSGAQQSEPDRRYPTVEELLKQRELPDKHDLKMAVFSMPKPGVRNTLLAKDPERQREIEDFQTAIKNAAEAGMPCLKYNMSLLPNLRTGYDEGRADTRYRSSNLAIAKRQSDELGLTDAGVVPPDLYWERLTYFLDRVVPVANEYKVRIACHPNDVIAPDGGYRGIVPVLGNADGLKRYVTINESPFHGLNLCLGVLSQGMMNPAEDIFEPLEWLSSRKKVFNVHFRNIKGNRLHYAEVAPDEGEADFTRAAYILAKNEYDGHITPDHGIAAEGDNTGGQAYWAFVYGYIAASLKAAERQLNS
jgi:mannonate dehydratase